MKSFLSPLAKLIMSTGPAMNSPSQKRSQPHRKTSQQLGKQLRKPLLLSAICLAVSSPCIFAQSGSNAQAAPTERQPGNQAEQPPSEIKTLELAMAEEALANSLPDVAAQLLLPLLETAENDDPHLPRILTVTSEALVRSQNPQQALDLIDRFMLTPPAEILFWQSQANASLGKLDAAAEQLLDYLGRPEPHHREAALMTAASLKLASQGVTAAADFLERQPQPLSPNISLMLAEFYMQQGLLEQASKLLAGSPFSDPQTSANSTESPPPWQPSWLDLKCRLLLAEGKFKQVFELTNSHPNLLDLKSSGFRIYRAQALLGQDSKNDAAYELTTLIQSFPKSPFLPIAFSLARQHQMALKEPLKTRLPIWSAEGETNLAAEASFTLANSSLHSSANPQERIESLREFLTHFPNHYLTAQAKLQLASLHFQNEQGDLANSLLDELLTQPELSSIHPRAQLLQAIQLAKAKNFTEAASRLDSLINAHDESIKGEIIFNRALLGLIDNTHPFQLVQAEISENLSASRAQTLEYQKALHKADIQPDQAIPLLQAALKEFPEHPLALKARIALTTCLLKADPPKLRTAKAQIDTLSDLGNLPKELEIRRYQLEIEIYRRLAEWPQVVNTCKAFLANHPEHPEATDFRLQQGQAEYQLKNYNTALLIFLQCCAKPVNSPEQQQNAQFLAALAATKIGTNQSLQQAIENLDKAATLDNQIGAEARLQAAKLLNDRLGKYDEALMRIQPLLTHKDFTIRLRSTLQYSEILVAQDLAKNPTQANEAREILGKLLQNETLDPAWRQRLIYRRAQIAAKAGQTNLALTDYFTILSGAIPANDQAATYWFFFESAGFDSIQLLEAQKRWKAAIQIANRLSAAKGPRAEEAAARANQIRLEHQIWENAPRPTP